MLDRIDNETDFNYTDLHLTDTYHHTGHSPDYGHQLLRERRDTWRQPGVPAFLRRNLRMAGDVAVQEAMGRLRGGDTR